MPKWIVMLRERKQILPILIGILGFLLLIFGGNMRNQTNLPTADDTESYFSVRFYTQDLEDRIEALCRQVHGIGEVHVLVTLEGGSEYVYAENYSGTSQSFLLTAKDGTEAPILVQEIYPQIRGIAVVCSRGDDTNVRLTITELLSAAFGISSSRIFVAGT